MSSCPVHTPRGPEDVVAVARRRESAATFKQIATDFRISEATLQNWLRQADVEEGNRPGQIAADATEARELKKRTGLSTALENWTVAALEK